MVTKVLSVKKSFLYFLSSPIFLSFLSGFFSGLFLHTLQACITLSLNGDNDTEPIENQQ